MKLVISPAKSLNWDNNYPDDLAFSDAHFLDEAVKVNAAIKKYSRPKLEKLQGISKALADLNYQRNQEWLAETDLDSGKPAAFAFDGDVYRGLSIDTWVQGNEVQIQEKLRILSGLYGILKPFDLIRPYRLEMGTKLKIRRSDNLYQFWKAKITPWLTAEMKEDEILINLASSEYFKAIDKKSLKRKVVDVTFMDRGKDKFKVMSFYAKKARGSMARYIIENNINDLNGVKNFDVDGYFFDEENSTDEKLVFLNERNT